VFGDDDFPCDQEEEEEAVEEEAEEDLKDEGLPPVDPKALKAIVKEGGKKGAEVAGAADMGGMTHMNISLELPEGRTDLMMHALEAMNVEIDPLAEETKGGAGHVAKALFSYGVDQVGVVVYVPKELQERVAADVWAKEILEPIGGELKKGANAKVAKGFVLGDADKDLYPIKMKDTLLQNSIKYLQKIEVFPSGDDSDSDEMVFGDDDFPCDQEEEAVEEAAAEQEDEAAAEVVDPAEGELTGAVEVLLAAGVAFADVYSKVQALPFVASTSVKRLPTVGGGKKLTLRLVDSAEVRAELSALAGVKSVQNKA